MIRRHRLIFGAPNWGLVGPKPFVFPFSFPDIFVSFDPIGRLRWSFVFPDQQRLGVKNLSGRTFDENPFSRRIRHRRRRRGFGGQF